ncbi:cupin domain-containing protein [Paraconexibacter antarcticus]|uniref:Cupin domain-containing protein n=1 Tax=Paraconexibacter antarcticus TaxID=2949664 RepID=A0ABY5DY30_9ACTN|nr:cupin domain-containing protein [Paraconexibacter antarcticus]UTI66469.1 cupin domain-containing protein [Paraconexibacter antarcticus]
MTETHPNLVHLDDLEELRREAGDIEVAYRRVASAAGARGIGATWYRIPPSARMMPVHVHSDEEEIFYVLEGSGLSWQDGRTYAVRAGDCLVHRIQGAAHTMIAGPEGMTVIAFAEGSTSNITYLPRTKAFWLGTRWLPADGPNPFKLEAALGPLELPGAPEAERLPSIRNLDEVDAETEVRPGYDITERDLARACGSVRSGLRHDRIAPGTLSCPPHWHSAEEECFLVLEGGGVAWLGDDRLPVRPGSVLVRPPCTRVAHAFEAGPDGLTYLAYGTRVPADTCFYPRSGKANIGGVTFRLDVVDYWEGEEGLRA